MAWKKLNSWIGGRLSLNIEIISYKIKLHLSAKQTITPTIKIHHPYIVDNFPQHLHPNSVYYKRLISYKVQSWIMPRGYSLKPNFTKNTIIKVPHGRAKRYWGELAVLASCHPKGRGIEPLLRLRSDEMDNRVTHFASSLAVINLHSLGERSPKLCGG